MFLVEDHVFPTFTDLFERGLLFFATRRDKAVECNVALGYQIFKINSSYWYGTFVYAFNLFLDGISYSTIYNICYWFIEPEDSSL